MSTPTTGLQSAYASLTSKQRLFVDRYLLCLNGTQAAREAGYSPKIVHEVASENLRKSNVKAAIDERLKAAGIDRTLSPERIKAKIAEKAFDDKLRPETQLKALELAGRATPGTFEPSTPSGPTFNVFNVLAKLATVAPSAYIDVATSTPSISTPTTSAAPLPPAVDPVAVAPSPSDAPTFSSAPGNVATPQAGVVYSDTTTPKFVAQKKEELTPVVGEKLQGEQTPSGGDGLAEGPASGGAA